MSLGESGLDVVSRQQRRGKCRTRVRDRGAYRGIEIVRVARGVGTERVRVLGFTFIGGSLFSSYSSFVRREYQSTVMEATSVSAMVLSLSV